MASSNAEPVPSELLALFRSQGLTTSLPGLPLILEILKEAEDMANQRQMCRQAEASPYQMVHLLALLARVAPEPGKGPANPAAEPQPEAEQAMEAQPDLEHPVEQMVDG